MAGLLNAALELHEAGRAAEAILAYQRVLHEEPQQAAPAYSNLGMILAGQGRLEEGEHLSRTAARLLPSNADVAYNLANTRMNLGRNSEAEAVYLRVVELQPRHAPSYNNLALLAQRRGEAAHARALFRSALRCGHAALAPLGGASRVYGNLAAAGLLGAEEALSMQRVAVSLAPAHADEYTRLAERLLDAHARARGAGRAAEAEAALRAARRLDPAEARASNALGALLQGAPGRWREAREAYEAAIRAQPLGGDAYHNLGTVLQRLGDHSAAKARHAPTTTAAQPRHSRSKAAARPQHGRSTAAAQPQHSHTTATRADKCSDGTTATLQPPRSPAVPSCEPAPCVTLHRRLTLTLTTDL